MKRALALSVAAALVLGSAAARADVAPPNSSECSNKNPGDACKDDTGNAGVCTSSTCTKLDYSHGTPPTSVSYACTLCVATDGGTSTPASDGGTSGSSSKSGCSTSPASATSPWWLAAVFTLPLLRRRRSR